MNGGKMSSSLILDFILFSMASSTRCSSRLRNFSRFLSAASSPAEARALPYRTGRRPSATTCSYSMVQNGWQYLYEHSHRLVASGVGLLTIALTLAFWPKSRRWLRWLGVAALLLVILQGVIAAFGSSCLRTHWRLFTRRLPRPFLP